MKCPYCGHNDCKVYDSRSSDDGSIKRRRECLLCQKRFTTYEKVDSLPIVIIKKNGSRQAFNKEKIVKGLVCASEKRYISFQQLNEIAESIESRLLNSPQTEFPSSFIGNIVMEKLKQLDDISYIRFASVYRQFKDVNSFINEINMLKEEKAKKQLEAKNQKNDAV